MTDQKPFIESLGGKLALAAAHRILHKNGLPATVADNGDGPMFSAEHFRDAVSSITAPREMVSANDMLAAGRRDGRRLQQI